MAHACQRYTPENISVTKYNRMNRMTDKIPTAEEARGEIALRNLDLVLESMDRTMRYVTDIVLYAIKLNESGASFCVIQREHLVHPLGEAEDVAHYISYRMEGKGYDIYADGTWVRISWHLEP